MTDREKVIKELEGVLEWLSEGDDRKCVAAYRAVEDVLELLKEQEFAKDTNVPNGGWISVKDRLPEQYEKTFRGILARNGEEIVKTRIVSDEVLVSYLNKYGRRKIGISYMLDGEWSGMFRSLAEIDVFTKAITHWMPLPSMPEEDEA